MTIDVPLRMENRTEMWIDGGKASFRTKLKPTVNKGSRGIVRGMRPAYELLALVHMANTAWMLLQTPGTSNRSPRDLEYCFRGTRSRTWRRFKNNRETRT